MTSEQGQEKEKSSSSVVLKTFTEVTKEEKIELKLIHKENYNDDVRLLRFALPSENHVSGIPLGCHVLLWAKDVNRNQNNANIAGFAEEQKDYFCRPYTPVSLVQSQKGYMDLIIKIYWPSFNEYGGGFVPGGKMGMKVETFEIGETCLFTGPHGSIEHEIKSKGLTSTFQFKKKPGPENLMKKQNIQHLCMIAGGSGITPMLQLIREFFWRDEKEKYSDNCINKTMKITLIYANKTEDDIICKKELDDMVSRSNGRFECIYVLSRMEDECEEDQKRWKDQLGYIGHVNLHLLRKHLPKPANDHRFILVCGPKQFQTRAVCQNLAKLGWDRKDIHVM